MANKNEDKTLVKIFSNRKNKWWKSDFDGYTDNEDEAGVYTKEEIDEVYGDINFDKTRPDYMVLASK